jgi:hypothetical protein
MGRIGRRNKKRVIEGAKTNIIKEEEFTVGRCLYIINVIYVPPFCYYTMSLTMSSTDPNGAVVMTTDC